MTFVDKDLQSIQEARVLAEAARDAQKILNEYPQKALDKIVAKLGHDAQILLPTLLVQEADFSGHGNAEDKITFAQAFFAKCTQELLAEKIVGIISEHQVGVPLGTIVCILPRENVVINLLYACLIAIKSGNALILVPDPATLEVASSTFEAVKEITESPENALSLMETVSQEGLRELTNHSAVNVVIAIDQAAIVDSIAIANPLIFGGGGATPVFIEKSADLAKTAEAIVKSRSFDNGLLPASEQYIISENSVADAAKKALIAAGAYFMSPEEEKRLVAKLDESGSKQRKLDGKKAVEIAEMAGFAVPAGTKVLVSEQNYIYEKNPFSAEQKYPLLTFYLEPDWLHACEKCIDLLNTYRIGQTLAIHSHDEKIIREFALKKPVGRMVVNCAASAAAVGLASEFETSLILGGLTTGRGYKANNISAKDLTYVREIGSSKALDLLTISERKNVDGKAVLEKLLQKLAEE
ncbi:aldehyde dehydrogenase family protein [Enterococcus hirae]|nr:aldehyde dehydrogenase family protein [Enterococcus hirae]